MHIPQSALAALALASAASANLLDNLSGLTEGHYIMSFKQDADQSKHYSLLEGLLGDHSAISHKYDGFFNGYALSMGSGVCNIPKPSQH